MSVPTPLGALQHLREVDAARDIFIASKKAAFTAIDEKAKAEKEELRRQHRDLNRMLIQAIRDAQTYGIHVEDSARTIGKSPQAIYRLEAEIKKADEQNKEENDGTT